MWTADSPGALSLRDALASARLLHRAGAPLPKPEVRRLPPAPVDRRPICPVELVPFVEAMVQHPLLRGVLPEFLALLAHRGWRLPPEWVPSAIELLGKKGLTPSVQQALGPLAAWLALHHPRWKSLFFPRRTDREGSVARRIAQPSTLRVRWEALPQAIWQRCVLDWLRDTAAWNRPDSVFVKVLVKSRHPWPDALTVAFAEQLEQWRRAAPLPHGEALLRAAALRSNPQLLLHALEPILTWPFRWAEVIARVIDILRFRSRLHAAFSALDTL